MRVTGIWIVLAICVNVHAAESNTQLIMTTIESAWSVETLRKLDLEQIAKHEDVHDAILDKLRQLRNVGGLDVYDVLLKVPSSKTMKMQVLDELQDFGHMQAYEQYMSNLSHNDAVLRNLAWSVFNPAQTPMLSERVLDRYRHWFHAGGHPYQNKIAAALSYSGNEKDREQARAYLLKKGRINEEWYREDWLLRSMIGDATLVDDMFGLFKDEEAGYNELDWALMFLQDLIESGVGVSDELKERLYYFIEHGEYVFAYTATHCIGALGVRSDVERLLPLLAVSTASEAVYEVIRDLSKDEATKVLQDILSSDDDDAVSCVISNAYPDMRLLPAIREIAKDPKRSSIVRADALKAVANWLYAKRDEPQLRAEYLHTFINDPDDIIAFTALTEYVECTNALLTDGLVKRVHNIIATKQDDDWLLMAATRVISQRPDQFSAFVKEKLSTVSGDFLYAWLLQAVCRQPGFIQFKELHPKVLAYSRMEGNYPSSMTDLIRAIADNRLADAKDLLAWVLGGALNNSEERSAALEGILASKNSDLISALSQKWSELAPDIRHAIANIFSDKKYRITADTVSCFKEGLYDLSRRSAGYRLERVLKAIGDYAVKPPDQDSYRAVLNQATTFVYEHKWNYRARRYLELRRLVLNLCHEEFKYVKPLDEIENYFSGAHPSLRVLACLLVEVMGKSGSLDPAARKRLRDVIFTCLKNDDAMVRIAASFAVRYVSNGADYDTLKTVFEADITARKYLLYSMIVIYPDAFSEYLIKRSGTLKRLEDGTGRFDASWYWFLGNKKLRAHALSLLKSDSNSRWNVEEIIERGEREGDDLADPQYVELKKLLNALKE